MSRIDLPPSRLIIAYLACACLLFALLPAAAMGARTNAPPGHAGVQEYVESIPDGSGGSPTKDIAQTRAELIAAGATQAEALAKATAPNANGPDSSAKDRRVAAGGAKSAPAAGLEPGASASSPGGMGIVLPIVMLVTVLVAAAYVISRRSSARAD